VSICSKRCFQKSRPVRHRDTSHRIRKPTLAGSKVQRRNPFKCHTGEFQLGRGRRYDSNETPTQNAFGPNLVPFTRNGVCNGCPLVFAKRLISPTTSSQPSTLYRQWLSRPKRLSKSSTCSKTRSRRVRRVYFPCGQGADHCLSVYIKISRSTRCHFSLRITLSLSPLSVVGNYGYYLESFGILSSHRFSLELSSPLECCLEK